MRWSTQLVNSTDLFKEISNIDEKREVAREIALKVKNDDVIGVGSGSTAFLALQEIGQKVKNEHLRIVAVPTSIESTLACAALGIPTTEIGLVRPDWMFDGADEVDSELNLIKGRGGALFKEKLMFLSSPEVYVLVDKSKLVSVLGQKFPIPIEIYPSALNLVETRLRDLGAIELKLRLAKAKDGPVITESGNLLVDAKFQRIDASLEKQIKLIPGVIESGLFIGYKVNLLVSK